MMMMVMLSVLMATKRVGGVWLAKNVFYFGNEKRRIKCSTVEWCSSLCTLSTVAA